MIKLFNLCFTTESEVQKLMDNCSRTDARIAMSQVDTSKPLSDYERGRRDAASDILLLVSAPPTSQSEGEG